MSQDAISKPLDKVDLAEPAAYEPLRMWPPLVLLGGMVLFRFLPHLIENGPTWIWMSAAFGPVLCGLLILIWWVTLSRATWVERLVGFFGTILLAVATIPLLHPTMRMGPDGSPIGPAVMVLTIPLGIAGFGIGAAACGNWLSFQRTVVALLLAGLGFGISLLFRAEGMWGNFALTLHWRWAPTSEEKVAQNAEQRQASSETKELIAKDKFADSEWPGFRGPNRDGRQRGTKIATIWSKPPEKVWETDVGPGWSSFAVAGNFLFTQEQRHSMETVVCYAADTGLEVWTRAIESRFDDPLGGPGPRATPTLADGGLYVTFAKGQVMRLHPATGEVVWEKDLQKIADRKPPIWGFSASPLVVGSLVIVHAGGAGDKGVLAFDKESGALIWSAPAGDHSYASPQLAKILGEPLVLMLTNTGLHFIDPASGAVRLNYDWDFEGYRATQPHVIRDDSILLSTPATGTNRIRISRDGKDLKAEEIWTSSEMKPEFNDFVVYQGHAYGFDGGIFASINLATGERNWKGGRYGKGQVLLLEDSAALLVMGEEGQVVLLKADPAESTEIARFQAIPGKTWNHPVVIGDRLYVRNSEKAACYKLPLAEGTK